MEQIVLANIMVKRDEELRVLEQIKRVVEEQLSPLRTYLISLVDGVYVDNRPVSPKKALIVVLADVMGLFLGMLWYLIVNSLRSQRQPTKTPSRGLNCS